MKALLLIAHGSRNPLSTFEITELTGRIRGDNPDYELIVPAFLELAHPDIESGFSSLVAQGAKHIDVLPYFLAQGNHVITDIPEVLDRLKITFPDIQVNMLPHIGQAADMVSLINRHIAEHRS